MPLRDPEARSAYNKRYAQHNKERLASYYRDYATVNADYIRVRKQEHYKAHKADVIRQVQEWRRRNPEKQRAKGRREYRKDPAKALARIKRWRQSNHKADMGRAVAYRRKRYRTDPIFAMEMRCRNVIRQALKMQGVRKVVRTMSLLGCSAPEFAAYLEARFQPGMTWENRRLWHVDHIRPCASFDLRDPAQQKACFHYTNLQPLWKEANQAKGAMFEGVSYRKYEGDRPWIRRQN